MALLTLIYVFLLFERALVLLASGDLFQIVFGLAILVFPPLAVWAIVSELVFGTRAAKLATEMLEGELPIPEDDLEPSGKATSESGDAAFAEIQARVEADEANPLLWMMLADCYDKLGDRRRARAAARRAISLAKKAGTL